MMNQLKRLKSLVEYEFGVDINKKTHQRNYVDARGIFSKLAKEELKLTYVEIGEFLSKSHATIINNVNKITDFISYDEDMRKTFYNILEGMKHSHMDLELYSEFELKKMVYNLNKQNELLKFEIKQLKECK